MRISLNENISTEWIERERKGRVIYSVVWLRGAQMFWITLFGSVFVVVVVVVFFKLKSNLSVKCFIFFQFPCFFFALVFVFHQKGIVVWKPFSQEEPKEEDTSIWCHSLIILFWLPSTRLVFYPDIWKISQIVLFLQQKKRRQTKPNWKKNTLWLSTYADSLCFLVVFNHFFSFVGMTLEEAIN